MISQTTPILAASDVAETIRFYKEVLGFDSSWDYGDPPTFGAAMRGQARVMFCLQPDLAAKMEGHQLWVDVEDVDALYAQHLERGAWIVSPVEDKPWNMREYTVRDPNGYYLRFAGQIGYTPKGTGVCPDGARVERRKPTKEEFDRVVGLAFGREIPSSGQDLETSWDGVVVLAPDGEVVGVLRIVCDAPGWFSLWDVGVVPDWQGRRLGSAMVEAAVDMIHAQAPGAWVYLFTYKAGFYERLGFNEQTCQMRRA
jgi:uncharacterized glyoxalase superfamily protein PhnB/N-acetylglutamate synthase-like GNAT family acetyltransferase